MTLITRRQALALSGSTLLVPALGRAADWPSGPVTFVVGYAAGGSSDINARELAHLMSPILGQQVIVDNKGGATGSIGLRAVAAAKPDGYTLFYAVSTNVIINPWVQKGMIDPIATLAPIWPAAPPLLSTMTCWPQRCESFCATRRAPVSVPPPGLLSTMTCWPRICASFSETMREEVSVEPPGA